jgi:hypothetical protein
VRRAAVGGGADGRRMIRQEVIDEKTGRLKGCPSPLSLSMLIEEESRDC